MTSLAPTPPKPSRVRVRWDNVMLVLVVIVIACFAGVGWILTTAGTQPQAPAGDTARDTATELAGGDAPEVDGALDIDDARGLVDDARALMTEARWDEAAEHLALVPEALRDESMATIVSAELAQARTTHDALRAQLAAMVEARRWSDAQVVVSELEAMAPLDEELLALRDQVVAGLDPAAAAAAAPTTPRADVSSARPAPARAAGSTGGGGGARGNAQPDAAGEGAGGAKPGATKPASSTATQPRPATPRPSTPRPASPRPAAAAPAPAAGTGGGGAAQPAAGAALPSSHDDMAGDLGLELTPAQQQAIEAALAEAYA